MLSYAFKIAVALALVMMPPSNARAGAPRVGHDQVPFPERQGGIVEVTLDFAQVLTLDQPASTIAIGNAGIVEASLSDDQTIVLTGQAPGVTNLIVLDDKGVQLANLVVRVKSGENYLTTVYRGSERQTYSCSDRCTPVVSIGDDPEFFNNTVTQIQTRQGLAGEAGPQ